MSFKSFCHTIMIAISAALRGSSDQYCGDQFRYCASICVMAVSVLPHRPYLSFVIASNSGLQMWCCTWKCCQITTHLLNFISVFIFFTIVIIIIVITTITIVITIIIIAIVITDVILDIFSINIIVLACPPQGRVHFQRRPVRSAPGS